MTPTHNPHRGIRWRIIEILKKHPKGLNAAKIEEILGETYVVATNAVFVNLSVMAKLGTLLAVKGCRCSECGKQAVRYKYRGGEA